MGITFRKSIYVACISCVLLLGLPLQVMSLPHVPPPASAHSTMDTVLLGGVLNIKTAVAPIERKEVKQRETSIPHSDTARVLPVSSQKAIDTVIAKPTVRDTNKEDTVNPYSIEKSYGIGGASSKQVSNSSSVVSTKPKTVKTVSTKTTTIPLKTQGQPSKSVKSINEKKSVPKGDGDGDWQASKYRFSPELNKISYPPDSPLKMISLQIMVEVSAMGSTASKARELLHKINKALPNAVLVAGLRELFVKDPVYPLAQWNRDTFGKAINKVSSHAQSDTIGGGLQNIRPSLLNLPYPISLLLITDGEDYNVDNLQFDTKIFYAPDPRSPLHIVSFANTNAEKKTIVLLQKVHRGSLVFDGYELLKDEALFAQFMKKLFVK